MQPTGLRSIRWQLPLTYAAIALVAAVALSALLIGILRQYYAQQEFEQLDNSSRGLARFLSFRLDKPLSADSVPAALNGIQFVPDFRVELLDLHGETVFDTGLMDTFTVSFGSSFDPTAPVRLTSIDGTIGVRGPQQESGLIGPVEAPKSLIEAQAASGDANFSVVPLVNSASDPLITTFGPRGSLPGVYWEVSSLTPVAGLAFDNAQLDQPILLSRQRSEASVTRIIIGLDGQLIGFVRLSNPPAIGSALIDSVTSSAVVAAAGAVLIAALLGWWVSLRLTRPLLALTEATSLMAQGDLSARVNVSRSDELGALADSFNAMAGKVEHTVAVLRRFAADAAHELHTPLTAIKTNLELTQERPDQARLREAVSQLERLQALADDLLDLSRLELADAPRTGSVDVGELVREVSEIYASRAEQAGVEFVLTMGDSLPRVCANPTLLRRALGNLLDNAVKFTPAGGDVSLATSAGDGALEFVVEDSGIGIPSGDLPALFSRFHRGSNTANYPGSGLGLAIVKAIADVHHGTVAAEGTARGARFVLRVPLVSAEPRISLPVLSVQSPQPKSDESLHLVTGP